MFEVFEWAFRIVTMGFSNRKKISECENRRVRSVRLFFHLFVHLYVFMCLYDHVFEVFEWAASARSRERLRLALLLLLLLLRPLLITSIIIMIITITITYY